MNQILFSKDNNIQEEHKTANKKKKMFFKVQLFFCSVSAFCISIYYAYSLYNNNRKEDISKKLVSNFNITSLYASDNYDATRTSNVNYYEIEDNNFAVIGLIEINSININYPIISTINDNLLKIAPCRFYRSYA